MNVSAQCKFCASILFVFLRVLRKGQKLKKKTRIKYFHFRYSKRYAIVSILQMHQRLLWSFEIHVLTWFCFTWHTNSQFSLFRARIESHLEMSSAIITSEPKRHFVTFLAMHTGTSWNTWLRTMWNGNEIMYAAVNVNTKYGHLNEVVTRPSAPNSDMSLSQKIVSVVLSVE